MNRTAKPCGWLGRGGKAHVNAIAHELAKTDLRDIDTIEQTVTRRVNDYCSDARDFKKRKEHDLFERIEPGTYRLRTYPDRPDIIELVRIEFDDVTMQSMWQSFKEAAHKQQRAKWSDASNERKNCRIREVDIEGGASRGIRAAQGRRTPCEQMVIVGASGRL